MRVALLQLNHTVGDVPGNAGRIEAAVRHAAAQGARLCVATELALSGYPPQDLLLDRPFVAACRRELEALAGRLAGLPPLLVGLPEENAGTVGNPAFNAAALCRDGRVESWCRKVLLPTYDVFDERRYFQPAEASCVVEIEGLRLGVTICEDIWNDTAFWASHRQYPTDPVEGLAARGVDVLVNLSASPFTLGKRVVREAMLGNLAVRHHVPVLYANQVGGNDDLVFDGRSMACDATGRLVARAAAFEEDILIVGLDDVLPVHNVTGSLAEDDPTRESQAFRALVLGTRDHVRKCGFERVLLGLSGGIDSSLTAAIAVEALGPERVLGALMPSPFSSRGSVDDSLALARNLGIQTLTMPIAGCMAAFDQALAEAFAGRERDVTEENIQARIRGTLLMALSNKYGAMLLTTGNKSELSVGYCTIYGDMAGGLAVIADAPKGLVYAMARWLNAQHAQRGLAGEMIPSAVLDKAPSAELRPGQCDQDSLPPYDVLDAILEARIERHESLEEIVAHGFDRATVARVLRLVHLAEFKRRQAPPGIKITDRAFGTGWRMPIACRLGWE